MSNINLWTLTTKINRNSASDTTYLTAMIVFTAVSILGMYVSVEYLRLIPYWSSAWLTGAGDLGGINHGVLGFHNFTDLSLPLEQASLPSPYLPLEFGSSTPASNYSPFVNLIFSFLGQLDYLWIASAFFVIVVFGLIVPISKLIKSETASLTIAVIVAGFLFAYPFLMVLDRGNLQGIVLICTLFALVFYVRENYRAFALLIGIAALIKIYPLIFLVLLLRNRRFLQTFSVTAVVIGINLAILPFFAGGFGSNLRGLMGAASVFTGNLSQTNPRIIMDRNHSILGSLAYLSMQDIPLLSAGSRWTINHYKVIFLVSMLIICIICLFKYLSDRQVWLIVGIALVLFPSISYGYVLTLLYPATVEYLRTFQIGAQRNRLILVLIAALFCAKGFPLGIKLSSLINVINPPIMLLLLMLAVIPEQTSRNRFFEPSLLERR